MDSKLVYRALRQISQWTVDGFYSEVRVSGQENVPATGPLIVTPCHHNEILDIATLAVTMPHRRPVCFWAKSTMFANSIAKTIMTSSGSIPVRRNPNNSSNAGDKKKHGSESNFALFRETFRALDKGEVVGVFPEGTSYTEPHIAQIKEGAAWAALEHARWQMQHTSEYKEGGPEKLMVVPVGIIYTDKSHFQSQVLVQYGKPIDTEPYAQRYLASNDPHAEVKELTAEIETRLTKLTVNAKDWDHCFAGTMAREIYHPELELFTRDNYVDLSQALMDRFDDGNSQEAVTKLVKYSGILYHAGISHGSLVALYSSSEKPSRAVSIGVFLREAITTVLHPRFLCFFPIGLLHIPAYIVGSCAARFLADPQEPETLAERKAVCGGVTFGATAALLGRSITRAVYEIIFASLQYGRLSRLPILITKVCSWLFDVGQRSSAAAFLRLLGMISVIYWTTWLLFRWHRALIQDFCYLLDYLVAIPLAQSPYPIIDRILTAWKILLGVWIPPSRALSSAELNRVSRPPQPKPNPFVKHRNVEAADTAPSHAPAAGVRQASVPSSRALISSLFAARAEAETAARSLLADRRATSQ